MISVAVELIIGIESKVEVDGSISVEVDDPDEDKISILALFGKVVVVIVEDLLKYWDALFDILVDDDMLMSDFLKEDDDGWYGTSEVDSEVLHSGSLCSIGLEQPILH